MTFLHMMLIVAITSIVTCMYKDKTLPVPSLYRKRAASKIWDNISNVLGVGEQFAHGCKEKEKGELYAETRNGFGQILKLR